MGRPHLSLPPQGRVPGEAGGGGLRTPVLAALALLLAAPLAACAGFTPLYATPNVTPALRAVDVVVPQGRAGFLLREQINDELARDFTVPARYRLNLTVAEDRVPRGLRVNNVGAEVEEVVRVSYVLIENRTGRRLLTGVVPVSLFFVGTDAPYAGIAAQQDAQERAASEVAVQIRLALSRQFARAAQPPGAR